MKFHATIKVRPFDWPIGWTRIRDDAPQGEYEIWDGTRWETKNIQGPLHEVQQNIETLENLKRQNDDLMELIETDLDRLHGR